MVLPAPAQIPARVLAALAAAEELGELHLTLAPIATWRSEDDPDPARGEVAELLTVLGWRGRGGALEREVVTSLTVLCQPAIAYYGWLIRPRATTSVLAAATGKEAMLAVRRSDATVWLSSIGAGRLVERLVAQTPDVPAGRGLPITVPLAELRATGRSGRVRTPGGVGIRRASSDVRGAQDVTALPVTGVGELWVETLGYSGRRRAERPVRYVDTVHGRYLQTVPRDGQLQISPARRTDLIAALHAAHRTLVAVDR